MASNVFTAKFRTIEKAGVTIYKYIVISSSGFASHIFKNNNPKIFNTEAT